MRAFRYLQRHPRTSWADMELNPWLYRITLNVCRSFLKKEGPRRSHVSLEDSMSPAQGQDCAEQACLRIAIEDALGQLPIHYREVALLRYVHQLSYVELAHVLQRPLGTVKARVHRSTRMLRRLLGSSLLRGEEEV